MARLTRTILGAAVLLLLGVPCLLVGQEQPDVDNIAPFARANLGLDVLALGAAVGAGGGVRLELPGRTIETYASLYWSGGPYVEEETSFTYDGFESTFIFALQVNRILTTASPSGLYFLAGTGFVAGSYSYDEVYWVNGSPDTTFPQSDASFASGTIVTLGAGWPVFAFGDLRIETPILLFWAADTLIVSPTVVVAALIPLG